MKINKLPVKKQKGFSHIEVLVVVVVLAVLWAGFFVWQKNRSEETALPEPGTARFGEALQKDLLSGPLPAKGVSPAPKLDFGDYVLAEDQARPALPAQVKIYTFAGSLSSKAVKKTPARLGLEFSSDLSGPDALVFTNLTDPKSLGYFVVDPKTGSFEFQSYGEQAPADLPIDATPAQIAENFLKEKGLWDETLKVTATYQRAGQPFTFVEVHRDWTKVGLPILSPVGVLNVPAEKPLSELEVGRRADYLPADASIINTSDKTDGRARPNDFNTLTVAVTADGRVWQMSSNLRPLKGAAKMVSRDLLRTPGGALADLKAGRGLFGFSVPAGKGLVDLAQVYPQNRASASKATVTDFELVYLEKGAGVEQAYLQPVYLFRGQAKLKSGYTVNWAQVVPALAEASKAGQSFLNVGPVLARETFAPTDSGMFVPGLGRFYIAGESHTINFEATTPAGQDLTINRVKDLFFDKLGEQYVMLVARVLQGNPAYLSQVKSLHSPAELYPLFARLNGHSVSAYQSHCLGTDGYMVEVAPVRKPQNSSLMCWDLVDNRIDPMTEKVANTILASVQAVSPTPLPTASVSSAPISTATPLPTATAAVSPVPTQPVYQPLELGEAGLYSTLTLSEWAERSDIFPAATLKNFAYAFMVGVKDSERKVGSTADYISGESPFVYFYEEGKRISPRTAGIKVKLPPATTYQELFADPIYYEYNRVRVSFSEPTEGWVVKTGGLQDWVVGRLAPQLGLNTAEAKSLQLELGRFELGNAPYVEVSLLGQAQLNQQLPLGISPRPDNLYRVNLLVRQLESFQALPRPRVTPIGVRSGLTAVEVGASLR